MMTDEGIAVALAPTESAVTPSDVSKTYYYYILQFKSGDTQVLRSELEFKMLQVAWADTNWFTFDDGIVRIDDVYLVRQYYAPILDALKKGGLSNDSWHAFQALQMHLSSLENDDFEDYSENVEGSEGYRSKV